MSRLTTFILISLLCLLASPSAAATYFCPHVIQLPATLGLKSNQPSQPQLRLVQAYLNNLRSVTAAFQGTRRKAQQNELTNCLMDHLYILPATGALQSPRTTADASTWQLLREEVYDALRLTERHLRFKPEIGAVLWWLEAEPPRTVASR